MRTLILCCNEQEVEAALPLAERYGLGMQLQAFYLPVALDNPASLLACHRGWWKGFTGLRALHLPFFGLIPGGLDPLVREVAAKRIRQGIAIAHELGVEHLVAHNGYYSRLTADAGWERRAIAFWRDILRELPDGMTIHLENAHEITPDMQSRIVEQIADPRLGLCLDIGHAHCFSERDPLAWIAVLQDKITFVHLHGNDGSADQHLPLGEGTIPLTEVLAALDIYASDAVWAIETAAEPSLAWLDAQGFSYYR